MYVLEYEFQVGVHYVREMLGIGNNFKMQTCRLKNRAQNIDQAQIEKKIAIFNNCILKIIGKS